MSEEQTCPQCAGLGKVEGTRLNINEKGETVVVIDVLVCYGCSGKGKI